MAAVVVEEVLPKTRLLQLPLPLVVLLVVDATTFFHSPLPAEAVAVETKEPSVSNGLALLAVGAPPPPPRDDDDDGAGAPANGSNGLLNGFDIEIFLWRFTTLALAPSPLYESLLILIPPREASQNIYQKRRRHHHNQQAKHATGCSLTTNTVST